jgi:predicted dehydrogenase
VIRPAASSPQAADTLLRMPRPKKRRGRPAALLGAGDYGRTEIIPALRAAGFSLQVVADRDPQIAALVAKRYGFNAATTDPRRAIDDLPLGGLAIVATAHDSHADLACRAAEAGHRVFLEKPPAVSPSDVARLASVMAAFPGAVEIGFNRRYHPLVRRVRSALATERGPMSAVCTVKELGFNPDHWYFWDNQGTRLTGNLCHWIDLMVSLLDGRPLPVSLTLSPRIANRASDDDERVLTVTFEDGSLFTVLGTNRGDDIRGVQEQLQIHKGHTTVIFDDMWKLRVRRGGLERYSRTLFRTKAHSQMYRTAFKRVLADEPSTYTIEDLAIVSAIQIAASTLVHGDQSAGEIPHWLHSVLDANASRAAAEMIDLPV